jgi:hypothetical protein
MLFDVHIFQDGAAPLDAPQDEIGRPLDAGMGEWNMGKGAQFVYRVNAT